MARSPLLECAFLIPMRRDRNLSDGKLHAKEAWLWLDKQLFQFGGATRQREPVEGWYIDEDTGKPVRDSSRKYFVAVARRDVNQLRGLLGECCGRFRQKCIYLSIAGRVEFVTERTDETN